MAKLVTKANKYSRLAGRPLAVAGGTYVAANMLSGKVSSFQNPWIAGGTAVLTAAITEAVFYYFGSDYEEADLQSIVSGMTPEEIKSLLVKMGMDENAAGAAAAAFADASKKKRKAS